MHYTNNSYIRGGLGVSPGGMYDASGGECAIPHTSDTLARLLALFATVFFNPRSSHLSVFMSVVIRSPPLMGVIGLGRVGALWRGHPGGMPPKVSPPKPCNCVSTKLHNESI